jgi:hypothetical protein
MIGERAVRTVAFHLVQHTPYIGKEILTALKSIVGLDQLSAARFANFELPFLDPVKDRGRPSVHKLCAQLHGHTAQSVGSPDASANAIARFQHYDTHACLGKNTRRRHTRYASSNHNHISRFAYHADWILQSGKKQHSIF